MLPSSLKKFVKCRQFSHKLAGQGVRQGGGVGGDQSKAKHKRRSTYIWGPRGGTAGLSSSSSSSLN